MESGDLWPFAAQQTFDPFAHFAGRLIGKGNGQNLPRFDPVFTHQPGNSMHNDPGFARAGTGQDQQWPGTMLYCLSLGRIEVLQKGHLITCR